MGYILDANPLIEAKNRYYGFDFCSAFWEWLERASKSGNVFSIERVCKELKDGNDELADWAKQRESSFFLPFDQNAHKAMTTVSDWVANSSYTDPEKRKFLAGADPFVIAYALAHGHTVVTHEVHQTGMKKLKIPSVCHSLNVPYADTFKMLRAEKALFVLSNHSQP